MEEKQKKERRKKKKKKEAAESSNVMTDAELEALGLPTLSSLQKLKNKLASVVSSPVPEDVTALSRPPPMVIMQPPVQPLPPPLAAASSFVDPVAPLSPRGFFVANSPAFQVHNPERFQQQQAHSPVNPQAFHQQEFRSMAMEPFPLRSQTSVDKMRDYMSTLDSSQQRKIIPKPRDSRDGYGNNRHMKRSYEDSTLGGENKGYNLLKQMGWDGNGLGKREQGIVTPVAAAGQTTFKLEATYDKYRSAKSNAYKNRQAMRGRGVGASRGTSRGRGRR